MKTSWWWYGYGLLVLIVAVVVGLWTAGHEGLAYLIFGMAMMGTVAVFARDQGRR